MVNNKVRGRPKDLSKTADLLKSARELFLKKGLEVTTDEICLKAKVAKATLYKKFKDKESLLEAVILNESVLTFTDEDFNKTKNAPIEKSLEVFGMKYLTFVNNREILEWDRLIASTFNYYPHMLTRFFNAGPGRGQSYLVSIIKKGIINKELKECDPYIAADELHGLWLGFTSVEIRLGAKEPLKNIDIYNKVIRGILLFMSFYKLESTNI